MVFETEETASFEIENAETCVISGIEPIEIGEEQSEAHKFGANAHVETYHLSFTHARKRKLWNEYVIIC